MSRYEILDLQKISDDFTDGPSPDDLLKTFINSFGPTIDILHKGMMKMDKDLILRGYEAVFGSFNYVTSLEMMELGHNMQETFRKITSRNPKEKDWQDLARIYIVFLEKCIVFKRELEDYSKKPILEPDLEGFIKETRTKFGVQEVELKGENASCGGCNIF